MHDKQPDRAGRFFHKQPGAQGTRDALEVWGDVTVRELGRRRQLEFVAALRSRQLSDWTITTPLSRIWAMINLLKRDVPHLVVPKPITAADWKPVLEDRGHTFTLEELATLFNACETDTPTAEVLPPAGVYGYGSAVVRAALREMPDPFSIEDLD